ncbi:3'(2'),5'-bisphosphate nucleotidase CysQ [Buchnera aphidicola]|uniref:3'(2'),5'-bisphosphate nucleotidase CysQ n=1 Tax=Buchnera aphidicola TaxID=9 RepID=UPI003464CBBE
MLNQICQIARLAGSVIMKFYHAEKLIDVSYKSDNTPITNVDCEANNIIKKELLSITPQIPIISEEEIYNFDICRHWNDYWLIDPLDGTKEFLKKNGEFTVNISLIKDGMPVLGVIYAPFFDVLYSSYHKESWKEKKLGFKENIKVSKSKISTFITSRSHPDKELKNYLDGVESYKIKRLGSSLKFCLVAEGTAQIYPRFGETYIWDTAAGHALVVASGGIVKTWKGSDLNYCLSSRSSFLNPGFYASA